jgi:NTE family protein
LTSGGDGSARSGATLGDRSLLGELTPPASRAVLARAVPAVLTAGEWLFRQGDAADALFVVESGRLDVIDDATGAVVRPLGPGSVIGELALLTGSPRTASVRARRDTRLLRLEAGAFEALLDTEPGLAVALTRAMAHRLASPPPVTSQRPASRVLLVAGLGPSARAAGLGGLLVEALRREPGGQGVLAVDFGQAVSEAGTSASPAVASDGELVAAFGRLLDRWEAENGFVVLVADPSDEETPGGRVWVDFCLRSADRVVLAVGGDDRVSSRFEAWRRIRAVLSGSPDLCFLETREPGLVREWLDVVQPRAHHRVITSTPADVAETVGRMARRLTGRSVGVVLSGGGARGFAHLGVLAALRDAGITIDRVGGCSIGSIMGALLAVGHPVETAIEMCRRFFVASNPLSDYGIPRSALLRGGKLRSSLQDAFGGGAIELLPRPFFCVSADLVRAESVIHRRGPLWEALLASVSIPGLLPPVPVGERLLVDGGVLNNLPIDVMAEDGEGPVIAVDVMRPFTHRQDGAGRRRLPPIAEVLTRVTVLSSWRDVEAFRSRAALVIAVPDEVVGMLDWAQLDRMVLAGRRAAEATLAAKGPLEVLHVPAVVGRADQSGGC